MGKIIASAIKIDSDLTALDSLYDGVSEAFGDVYAWAAEQIECWQEQGLDPERIAKKLYLEIETKTQGEKLLLTARFQFRK